MASGGSNATPFGTPATPGAGTFHTVAGRQALTGNDYSAALATAYPQKGGGNVDTALSSLARGTVALRPTPASLANPLMDVIDTGNGAANMLAPKDMTIGINVYAHHLDYEQQPFITRPISESEMRTNGIWAPHTDSLRIAVPSLSLDNLVSDLSARNTFSPFDHAVHDQRAVLYDSAAARPKEEATTWYETIVLFPGCSNDLGYTFHGIFQSSEGAMRGMAQRNSASADFKSQVLPAAVDDRFPLNVKSERALSGSNVTVLLNNQQDVVARWLPGKRRAAGLSAVHETYDYYEGKIYRILCHVGTFTYVPAVGGQDDATHRRLVTRPHKVLVHAM